MRNNKKRKNLLTYENNQLLSEFEAYNQQKRKLMSEEVESFFTSKEDKIVLNKEVENFQKNNNQ